MEKITLNDRWMLREEELFIGTDKAAAVAGKKDGWYTGLTLPCDVHMPLIACGKIGDPMEAKNSETCEWIEDRSWWFKRLFAVPAAAFTAMQCLLVLDGLDAEADIFLNGVHLGHHRSQTYPFRADVRDYLTEGDNELLVRVTVGLEHYCEQQLSTIHWKGRDYNSNRFLREVYNPRRDDRRVFVRKPQYVFGWDWMPRIATCGITGDVYLEIRNDVLLSDIRFATEKLREEYACVRIEVEVQNLQPVTTQDAEVKVCLSYRGETVRQIGEELSLNCGVNILTYELELEDPHIWWPNGMGEPELYTVRAEVVTGNGSCGSREIRCGIRTVALDKTKLAEGRRFAFVVNGRRIYCKGANWVTPDAIYARASDEKITRLVREAKAANFNMIRIWGGGPYPPDSFYEACDENGILMWWDFMFACGAYPDHEEWFVGETGREFDHQIRRVRSHPSLAVWCGNNECQITLEANKKNSYLLNGNRQAYERGMYLYNQVIPRFVQAMCPELPYVNSSPFGGRPFCGREDEFRYLRFHNSPIEGDAHPYRISFMNHKFAPDDLACFRPMEFDRERTRFASEFGCIGPARRSSALRYFGGEPVSMESGIWEYHKNEMEAGFTEDAILWHYGIPKTELTMDGYLLYGGLFQSMMLEQAVSSFRTLPENYGALTWSYNDAWTENGWSMIDYYETRKISYYGIRRAFSPRKLFLRRDGLELAVYAANDTRKVCEGTVEYGYTSLDGTVSRTETTAVSVPPMSKAVEIARFCAEGFDAENGVFFARTPGGEMEKIVYREVPFRQLKAADPGLQVLEVSVYHGKTAVTVRAKTYAHAVHLAVPDTVHCSDAFFDLLPGEVKTVTADMVMDAGAVKVRSVVLDPIPAVN